MIVLDEIINFADRFQKQSHLTFCATLDRPMRVVMEPHSDKRSNQANRYYFGVIVKALCIYQRQQGVVWSKDRCHDFIVSEVLGVDEVVHPITGEVRQIRKETKNMSVEAFSEFVELAHVKLVDWNIPVMSRDEFGRMESDCTPSAKGEVRG